MAEEIRGGAGDVLPAQCLVEEPFYSYVSSMEKILKTLLTCLLWLVTLHVPLLKHCVLP